MQVEKDIISDSGSETASESMMPHSTEGDNKVNCLKIDILQMYGNIIDTVLKFFIFQQEDGMEGNLTGLAKTEKLEGSMEQYLDQPTQEYSYKNPGSVHFKYSGFIGLSQFNITIAVNLDECPIVFCIGTDDEETDDESEHKKETATRKFFINSK